MKLIKTIFLARHGKTIYNDDDLLQGTIDLPLSNNGRKEAERLADRLQKEKIEFIYHSPLQRAFQTAEIVNQQHHVGYKAIPCFTEIDMGEWEGLEFFKLVSDSQEFHTAWLKNPQVTIPGGESFAGVVERVKPGVAEILSAPYESFLVVAHAAVNRAILANILGMPAEPARLFRMKNGAFSKFNIYEIGTYIHTVVEYWNNDSHLEAIA